MLIEAGVLRVRAGLTPVVITLPLGASSRRGAYARGGELAEFALYARRFGDPGGFERVVVREDAWLAASDIARAVGRTDAKGTASVPAHDHPGLRNLFFSVRVYKNAANFEVALTLAWHPESARTAVIVGAAGAAERRMRHVAPRFGLDEALVLDPHRWALALAAYTDDTPPMDNFLGKASARLGLVPAPDAPLAIVPERAPRRAGETGTTVAIDFGTHETSVVTQREGQRDVTVQGPFAPWSFHAVEVSLQGEGWHAEFIAPPRSFEERTTLGNAVMPPPLSERWSVLARRADGPRRDEPGIPSVLIPQEKVPPGLAGHPFEGRNVDPLIGQRVQRIVAQLIDARRSRKDVLPPVEGDPPRKVDPMTQLDVDDLEPSPKLRIGREPGLAMEFLDGVFGELAAREIVAAGASDGGLGAVGPILLSYPVAFLAQDRETLEKVARVALEQSPLRGLCGERPDPPLTFLDEATAAALGVLYHRFGSLSLDHLLDVFQPMTFDDAKAQRAVRILTFDCGGGTTDLVLLRLREDGDRVVSEIEDFYGLPFAGVEITRRIARELKRRLRAVLPADQVERLRTRFARDDGPAETPSSSDLDRMARTLGFFNFGEAVKLALATGTGDEAALRRGLAARAQEFLGEFDVTQVLNAVPSRAWLEQCVVTVLAPALETAERWLAQTEAPVQLLLASGRSSQLPGVTERLRAACASAPRPVLAQHVLSPKELASTEQGFGFLDLHAAQRGSRRADLSKFGVAIGLAHGYVLTTKTGEGQRLVVHPIDEHKRTRYLGILRQEGRGVQFVMPEDRLVVRADNKPVAPEQIVWMDEQPFAQRAVLGQNFRGPPRPGTAGSVDPPVPFAQVRFAPASLVERERLGLRKVQVGFAQRTSSEVVLAGLRVEKANGVEEVLSPDGASQLTAGGLTAHFESRRLEFDFRRNGAIDPEDLDRE